MKLSRPQDLLALSILGISAAFFSTGSFAAIDADAAQALAKKSDCMKCHAIDKDKKASSYKSIAAKWKGKADAEAKLIDNLTKSPKVKMKDGTEEEHKAVQTKDTNEIKNLIAWILSQ
jgi:cytochrome c